MLSILLVLVSCLQLPMQTLCLLAGHAKYHDLSSLDLIRTQVFKLIKLDNVSVLPFDPDIIFQWTPLMNWWQEEFKYVYKGLFFTTCDVIACLSTDMNLQVP